MKYWVYFFLYVLFSTAVLAKPESASNLFPQVEDFISHIHKNWVSAEQSRVRIPNYFYNIERDVGFSVIDRRENIRVAEDLIALSLPFVYIEELGNFGEFNSAILATPFDQLSERVEGLSMKVGKTHFLAIKNSIIWDYIASLSNNLCEAPVSFSSPIDVGSSFPIRSFISVVYFNGEVVRFVAFENPWEVAVRRPKSDVYPPVGSSLIESNARIIVKGYQFIHLSSFLDDLLGNQTFVHSRLNNLKHAPWYQIDDQKKALPEVEDIFKNIPARN